MSGKCLACSTDMFLEGKIYDDIQLCHGCYKLDNLLKFGYVTADELAEQFNVTDQPMIEREPNDQSL